MRFFEEARVARRWFLMGVVCASALAACSRDGSASAARAPTPDDMPKSVDVAGATVVSGFARGRLRRGYDVAAFRITKHPITVREYRACVGKGACTEPASRSRACRGEDRRGPLDRATFEAGADLPLTCVTTEQAKQYCQWVGGALPDPQEWMLAARGPGVARFAWGDGETSCAKHPGAGDCGTPADRASIFAIGQHAEGASPSGVEDVLLARAELVAASENADFTSCAPPRAACSFYGTEPGAIDSVEAVFASPDENESAAAAAFRCAWRKDSR